VTRTREDQKAFAKLWIHKSRDCLLGVDDFKQLV